MDKYPKLSNSEWYNYTTARILKNLQLLTDNRHNTISHQSFVKVYVAKVSVKAEQFSSHRSQPYVPETINGILFIVTFK
jgi:hypothetical protein